MTTGARSRVDSSADGYATVVYLVRLIGVVIVPTMLRSV